MSSDRRNNSLCDGAYESLLQLSSTLDALIAEVEEPEISRFLRTLLVDTLMQADELGLESDSMTEPSVDARSSSRIRTLGSLNLRNEASTPWLKGHCLNLSLGGICAHLEKAPEPGALCQLEVRPFGSQTAMSIRGQVRWRRRVQQLERFWVGIEFLSGPEMPAFGG